MSLLPSLIFGFLLSVACGLRIFIPFLCLNIFVNMGLIVVPDTWSWVGSSDTFSFLLTATIIEFIAVYFPIISTFYKTITVPVALISGAYIISFFLFEENIHAEPLLRWTIAIVFGGTIATICRVLSLTIDAGVPHPLKFLEDIVAVGGSLISIGSVTIFWVSASIL